LPEGFDSDAFGRYLTELPDAEILSIGRAVCANASRWSEQSVRESNKLKYRLCKKEWDRRHPRKNSALPRKPEDRSKS